MPESTGDGSTGDGTTEFSLDPIGETPSIEETPSTEDVELIDGSKSALNKPCEVHTTCRSAPSRRVCAYGCGVSDASTQSAHSASLPNAFLTCYRLMRSALRGLRRHFEQ